MLALACLTPAFTPSRQPWALPPSTRACRIRAAADDGVGGSLAVFGGSLARVADSTDAVGWQRVGPGWLRLGPATPWATVHFVGGAALGIALQLAYDTLLSRLASSADVAVIATPYELGLDHRKLARRVASDFDAALEESRAQGLAPPEGAPVFRENMNAVIAVHGEPCPNSPPTPPLLASSPPPPPPPPASPTATLPPTQCTVVGAGPGGVLAADVMAGADGCGDSLRLFERGGLPLAGTYDTLPFYDTFDKQEDASRQRGGGGRAARRVSSSSSA